MIGIVETWGDWGTRVDRLDGIRLTAGELLAVQWPDGSLMTIEVELDYRTEPVSDMGHTYTAEVSLAQAVVDYHGVKARVPLTGLPARRV